MINKSGDQIINLVAVEKEGKRWRYCEIKKKCEKKKKKKKDIVKKKLSYTMDVCTPLPRIRLTILLMCNFKINYWGFEETLHKKINKNK